MWYNDIIKLKEKRYEQLLYGAIDKLIMYNQEGKDILGSKFYCLFAEIAGMKSEQEDNISNFISDVKKSFEYEKRITTELERSNLIDYVVCGGGVEGHKLQKEVNFSDTVFVGDELVRIPGNRNGLKWSFINAHGWFSYELKVKPKAKNLVKVVVGGKTDRINFKLIIGKDEHVIDMPNNGKTTIEKEYNACDEQSIRIKVDKISGHTPCVYIIETLQQ